jgi:hypothetical protein
LAPDTGASVSRLHIPAFDVADGLSGASLRPVAERNLHESNELARGKDRDEDRIAMGILEEFSLFALELFLRVVWPEELAEQQPSVVLVRPYVTDVHDVPAGA